MRIHSLAFPSRSRLHLFLPSCVCSRQTAIQTGEDFRILGPTPIFGSLDGRPALRATGVGILGL